MPILARARDGRWWQVRRAKVSDDYDEHDVANEHGTLGFFYLNSPAFGTFFVPHWFLVLLTASQALLLKPKPRLKFSLRELVVLTTVAAIMCGGVAVLASAGKG